VFVDDHRDFGGRVTAGNTQINDGRGTEDCQGHGTHVAGTVGGQLHGVAKAVTIVPIRVLSCTGSGSMFGVINGVNWMIQHHLSGVPAVANMSLGGSRNTSMNQAVANAVLDGITMVVAAGNSRRDASTFSPASEPSAVTVGATASNDSRASIFQLRAIARPLRPRREHHLGWPQFFICHTHDVGDIDGSAARGWCGGVAIGGQPHVDPCTSGE